MWFVLIILGIIITLIFVVLNIRDKGFKKIFLKERRDKKGMAKDLKDRDNFILDDWEHISFDDVEIESKEGFKLKGYFHGNDTDKFVIIHHGYSANHFVCYQFLEVFLDEGYNILLIDMRNHGESEGEYISYGYFEVDDLDRWVEYLKSRYGNDIKIGLHGQSMGGATVLLYAGKYSEKIKFVIADSPYKSASSVIKHQIVTTKKLPFQPFYFLINQKCKRKYKFDLNDVNPIIDIKGKDVPILFIHGTKDILVPYTHSVDMYGDRCNKADEIFLVPGARHVGACSSDRNTYNLKIKEFINKEI